MDILFLMLLLVVLFVLVKEKEGNQQTLVVQQSKPITFQLKPEAQVSVPMVQLVPGPPNKRPFTYYQDRLMGG